MVSDDNEIDDTEDFDDSDYLDEEKYEVGMRNYQRKLKPLVKSLSNFDTKKQHATSGDVKGVLKFFLEADNETDALIDDAMELVAVLFVTATTYCRLVP